ncbi:hypothetical protein D3C87_679710 [compost metagenome]
MGELNFNIIFMRKLIVLLSCIFFLACSKDFYFKRDQNQISKSIKHIVSTDQAVRKFKNAVNTKYGIRTPNTVWDSLTIVGADRKSVNVSKLPSINQQLKKLRPEANELYNEDIEVADQLMVFTDSLHLDQIYKITKKYGYPSYDTRPWKNDSVRTGCGFVLTHFNYNEKKATKLLKLIIKEHTAGRLTDEEMRYFIWNANGREGVPDLKNLNIDAWVKEYIKKK